MGEIRDAAGRIEESLLGGPRRYTRAEVAALSGVPPARGTALWTALGFPSLPDDEAAFTDADVDAMRALSHLASEAEAGDQGRVAAARTLGRAMARLTEWQAELIGAAASGPQADGAASATVETLAALQNYAWRRHLAAALARSSGSDGPAGALGAEGTTHPLLVGFADMVGYTRLSRHLDPSELTALLTAFEQATTQPVVELGGWVIKNVGDEVMFAASDPAAGARIALAMQSAIADAGRTVEEMPQLRIGLAYGEVLSRFGDLYGPVVNLAARLTGVARPGTVLVDDGAAAALGDDEFAFRDLHSVRVKGIPRLTAHVLRAREEAGRRGRSERR